jgi:hypothetical protein
MSADLGDKVDLFTPNADILVDIAPQILAWAGTAPDL